MPASEADFKQALLDTVKECRRIGYNPSRFEPMIHKPAGPVEAVRSLLYAPNVSPGFTTLYEKGRLDLAVEAIILKPEWHGLFTAEERQAARERLASVHYRAPWDDGTAPAGER